VTVSEPIPFEVYAIRYATVARRSAENFIGGDPHESGARMDYFVWLARNALHTFVIDTGFNEAAAQRRRREFLRSPVEGLRILGVDAATISDVIITHLHYDHVGNFDQFPQARFHLQDRELAYATGRYMAMEFFSYAYEVDEVVAMVRNVYAGRVEFYDGDADVAPGISVHHVGGHTRGLQVVRIWTRVGWLVLASDASHYYANMEEQRPFPVVARVTEMVDGWRKLRRLADDPRHIIPGHDPSVMERYRTPNGASEGIAVRLDAEPVK
jgi:glyoxylase-like metal-dependent hydrolase (beta-lactamase superfamily II)